MPRTRNPYPSEFRDPIVALAGAGRSTEDLAREIERVPRPSTAGSSRPIVMAAAAMMG